MSDEDLKTKIPPSLNSKIGLKDSLEFLKEYEFERIHKDFLGKVVTIMIAALGFITVLSWDDTLKLLYKELFGSIDTLGSKFLYSILVTLVAVSASILLGRFFLNKKHGDK